MIYLDNAATTFPKPVCLLNEINSCLKTYCGNPGRSAHDLSIKSAEKIFEARSLVGEFFNSECPPPHRWQACRKNRQSAPWQGHRLPELS